MLFETDLTGQRVIVLGEPVAARRAVRRYAHAGGVVRTAESPEAATATSCSLGELDAMVREAGCSSPAVVVVGEVVRLGGSWRLAAAAGERAGTT